MSDRQWLAGHLSSKAPPADAEFDPYFYGHSWDSWRSMDKPRRTQIMRESNAAYRRWRAGHDKAVAILKASPAEVVSHAALPVAYADTLRDAAVECWSAGKDFAKRSTEPIIVCRQGRIVRPGSAETIDCRLPDRDTVGRLREALTEAGWTRQDILMEATIKRVMLDQARAIHHIFVHGLAYQQSELYNPGPVYSRPDWSKVDALPTVPIRVWRQETDKAAACAFLFPDGSAGYWMSSDYEGHAWTCGAGDVGEAAERVRLVGEHGLFGPEVAPDLAVPIRRYTVTQHIRWD